MFETQYFQKIKLTQITLENFKHKKIIVQTVTKNKANTFRYYLMPITFDQEFLYIKSYCMKIKLLKIRNKTYKKLKLSFKTILIKYFCK